MCPSRARPSVLLALPGSWTTAEAPGAFGAQAALPPQPPENAAAARMLPWRRWQSGQPGPAKAAGCKGSEQNSARFPNVACSLWCEADNRRSQIVLPLDYVGPPLPPASSFFWSGKGWGEMCENIKRFQNKFIKNKPLEYGTCALGGGMGYALLSLDVTGRSVCV